MRLRGFPLKLVLWISPLLYKSYMRLVFLTSKKSFEAIEPLQERLERGQTVLTAVWHKDAVIGPFALRKMGFVTMVSTSGDGEIFQQVVSRCGFTTVRGSSSRRGAEALKGLIDYVKRRPGSFCGVAVDGPRGPARKVKKGIVSLAEYTDVPVFPVLFGAKKRILNKSWDETMIPLPFNKLVVLCGEPVSVDANAGRNEIEAARVEIEDRLNELAETIEAHFGGGREEQEG